MLIGTLEKLELTLEERRFLLAYLKTALFEELDPMRKDAIAHIKRPFGRYQVLGATIEDNQYIVNVRDDEHTFKAIVGEIPDIYQDNDYFPFGEIEDRKYN